jgi:hypothetical protein
MPAPLPAAAARSVGTLTTPATGLPRCPGPFPEASGRRAASLWTHAVPVVGTKTPKIDDGSA